MFTPGACACQNLACSHMITPTCSCIHRKSPLICKDAILCCVREQMRPLSKSNRDVVQSWGAGCVCVYRGGSGCHHTCLERSVCSLLPLLVGSMCHWCQWLIPLPPGNPTLLKPVAPLRQMGPSSEY